MLRTRFAFLITCSEELKFELRIKKEDLSRYFNDYILVTDSLDFEQYRDEIDDKLLMAAKQAYIHEVVNNLDVSFEELQTMFGTFSSDTNLFDKWWSIRHIECSEIPSDLFEKK